MYKEAGQSENHNISLRLLSENFLCNIGMWVFGTFMLDWQIKKEKKKKAGIHPRAVTPMQIVVGEGRGRGDSSPLLPINWSNQKVCASEGWGGGRGELRENVFMCTHMCACVGEVDSCVCVLGRGVCLCMCMTLCNPQLHACMPSLLLFPSPRPLPHLPWSVDLCSTVYRCIFLHSMFMIIINSYSLKSF